MPQGKPTPQYKFRLLCRRCNSYMHTTIKPMRPLVERPGAFGGLYMVCTRCGNEADDLDETVD